MFARVIIDLKTNELNRFFDYHIPPSLTSTIQRGMRILVPFGEQVRMGYVVTLLNESTNASKDIIEVLDQTPVINQEQFQLFDFLMQIPKANPALVFSLLIPNEFQLNYQKRITVLDSAKLTPRLRPLLEGLKHYYPTKSELAKISLETNLKKGAIKLETIIKSKSQVKTDQWITFAHDIKPKTEKQYQLYLYLKEVKTIKKSELLEQFSLALIKQLIKQSILIEESKEVSPSEVRTFTTPPLRLKPSKLKIKTDQDYFIGCNQDKYAAVIAEIINQIPGQVLILSPSIPMVNQLKTYFDPDVNRELYQYHSEASKDQRLKAYAISTTDPQAIILGTQSSLFLPFFNLKSIIVIEPHQEGHLPFSQPDYDPVDVIEFRKTYHQANVVYLSFSYDVKRLSQINAGELKLIDLKTDYQIEMNLIDMKEELVKHQNPSILSIPLKEALEKNLKNDQLTCILMNQKGYAKFVMCKNCGHIIKDEETQTPLVYYDTDKKLRSKYSKTEIPFTKECPQCHQRAVEPVWLGLDHLYFTLKKNYPEALVIKIDANTHQTKLKIQTLQSQIKNSKKLIIVGTQGMMKYLVNQPIEVFAFLLVDQMLRLPFYDAYEKTLLKLCEVKELKIKRLMIQTNDPTNQVLKAFVNHQELKFIQSELTLRSITSMPPYQKISSILFQGSSYLKTYQKAFLIKKQFDQMGIDTLGIIPSYLVQSDGRYRFILTIKYHQLPQLALDLLNQISDHELDITFYQRDYIT